MFDTYSALVRRSEEGLTTSYYYPDFNYSHLITSGSTNSEDRQSTTMSQLEEMAFVLRQYMIAHYQNKKPIPFPTSSMVLQKKFDIGPKDLWVLCAVTDAGFRKNFEKFLPCFGIFSNIMAAVTMAIIDFAVTSITVGSNSGLALGISGGFLSAIMALIIYGYSDADSISRRIGRKIDNRKLPSPKTSTSVMGQRKDNKYAKLVLILLLTSIPLLTTLFTSYSHYNQVNSAIDKEFNDHKKTLANMLKTLNVVMIIFSSYSKFVFQLSFMPSLYNKLTDYVDKKLPLRTGESTPFAAQVNFSSDHNNEIHNQLEA